VELLTLALAPKSTFCVLSGMEAKPPSLAMRLRAAGLTKSHAYMVARGDRSPSLQLAVKIHSEIGVKLGPIACMTDAQIKALARSIDVAA
jgi:hypothetical protein